MTDKKLVPANTKELEKLSTQWVEDQKKVLRQQGMPEEAIAARFAKNSTFERKNAEDAAYERERKHFQEEKPTEQNTPELDLPDSFDPSAIKAKPNEQNRKRRHPLLQRLENEFGIAKLATKVIALGSHTFTFRPKSFRDYEWMTNNIPPTAENQVAVSSFQVTSVASGLAAIDDVPIYELFDIDVTGRFIPDKNYPPPDIREAAQNTLLQWLRDDVGLWELIPALDNAYSNAFEEEKDANYPLRGLLEGRQVINQAKENAFSQINSGVPGEGA